MKRLLLALTCLVGLGVGFTGCQDRTESALNAAETTDPGQVSFRLSAADLAKLGADWDSVRIEAVRPGYPTQAALGDRTQEIVLKDLQAGPWTLKVALFDRTQSIRWYGEAQVQILGGRQVDAEVHLRAATGSVKVHIVVDSLPSSDKIDTILLTPGSVKPSWTPSSVYRTPEGIYLEAEFPTPCDLPVVSYDSYYPLMKDSSGKVVGDVALPVSDPLRWVLGMVQSNQACIEVIQKRTIFVPFGRTEAVTLVTSTGIQIVPGITVEPPPADTGVVLGRVLQRADLPRELPVLQAFGTDSGYMVLTSYTCAAPVAFAQEGKGDWKLVFGDNPDLAIKCSSEPPSPKWVYLPWKACGLSYLSTPGGKGVAKWFKSCQDPVVTDSMWVKLQDGSMFSRVFGAKDVLPAESVVRKGNVVEIRTRFDCNVNPMALSNVAITMENTASILPMPGPNATQSLILFRGDNATLMACPERPVVVQVWVEDAVTYNFYALAEGKVYSLPGSSVVRDSLMVQYQSDWPAGGRTVGQFTYHLDRSGSIEHRPVPGWLVVDTLVVPDKVMLSPDSLAVALKILNSDQVRQVSTTCSTDLPMVVASTDAKTVVSGLVAPVSTIQTRTVDYANGAVSAQKWDHSVKCVPPLSWSVLDRVDQMLASAFLGR